MSAAGALLLFSGGQDSTVCLAWALQRFERVETIGFDYGQRHAVELEARAVVRKAIATDFPSWGGRLGADSLVDLRSFGAIGGSALTVERPIAVGDEGPPSTFVPGRNLVFLLYAAALADRRGLATLVGGMCETDYSGYADCRRATLDALELTLRLGMERNFPIETPLMALTKAQTWALAKSLGGEDLVRIIIDKTHTCYLGVRDVEHRWGRGCGECPACLLRSAGYRQWREAGCPALVA